MNYYYNFVNPIAFVKGSQHVKFTDKRHRRHTLYTNQGTRGFQNRSVSQQILYLVKRYIANRKQFQEAKMPAQVLLDLSESWEDSRNADEIVSDVKNVRKNSSRFKTGSDVFT